MWLQGRRSGACKYEANPWVQVEILQLENNLAQARQRLGEMRKVSYQE